MILQDITYLKLSFSDIKDPVSFFKSGNIGNVNSLRTLWNNIKIIWNLRNDEIKMALAEGGGNQEIYRFTLISKKSIFGFLVYIPGQKRIDLYTSENINIPLVQWKGRKIVYKTYPLLLDKMGIERLFEKLTIIL